MPVRRSYELFWDRYAKMYTAFQERKNLKLYNNVGEFINKFLDSKMSVLELACGTGQITKRCASHAGKWTATDFSENMIECAKKECGSQNAIFGIADAHSLKYPDESYDAVVIANALHIMPEPEKALAEIRRVLKQDGILIAPTFVYEGAESVKRKTKLMFMKCFGFKPFSKWTSVQYRDFVTLSGYKVIQQKLFGDDVLPECVLVCKKEDNNAQYI